ncbi:hypothetical protein ACFYO5_35940 [Streptomyces sp. NPDC006259]|uniref:hypothetical protein n=1 Tax=Streptomyces sp. NPDC006259 TaxID=3364740 RepID=UPI0036AEB7AE
MGIGPGAGRWLKEAGPVGAILMRAKMARAVKLATVLGNDKADQTLGLAATAVRFADCDLLSILGHIDDSNPSARSSARTKPTRSRREPVAGRPSVNVTVLRELTAD